MARREGQRRTPAGLRRRAELMGAAVDLAAEHGFERTRISDIVGRVGVGQGVFYWYFESKDALFREVFEDATRRMRLFQGAWIAGEPDPVRRVAKGIVASFDFIVGNAHVIALLDHRGPRSRRRTPRRRSVYVLDAARHIDEAMDAGVARLTDGVTVARSISAVVDSLVRNHLAFPERPLDDVIQDAIDFCLGGLLGQRAMTVADLRAEVEVGEELARLRDRVGASADGRARSVVPQPS